MGIDAKRTSPSEWKQPVQQKEQLQGLYTNFKVVWGNDMGGGAKRMGGGKRTRERTLPKISWTHPKGLLVCSVVDFCTGKTEQWRRAKRLFGRGVVREVFLPALLFHPPMASFDGVTMTTGEVAACRVWGINSDLTNPWNQKCFNQVHFQTKGFAKFSVFLKRVSLLNPRVRTNFVAFLFEGTVREPRSSVDRGLVNNCSAATGRAPNWTGRTLNSSYETSLADVLDILNFFFCFGGRGKGGRVRGEKGGHLYHRGQNYYKKPLCKNNF